MPLALVGVGLAWMMLADRRDRYARPPYWDEDDDLAYGTELHEDELDYEDELYGAGRPTTARYGRR